MRNEIKNNFYKNTEYLDEQLEYFLAIDEEYKKKNRKMIINKEQKELKMNVQNKMNKEKIFRPTIQNNEPQCLNIINDLFECYNNHSDDLLECKFLVDDYKICTHNL